MGGSRLVRARTAVDLPVPLCPQMRTPPIDGLMALRMRASRIFCCPTIALNGNVAMFLLSLLVPPYAFKLGNAACYHKDVLNVKTRFLSKMSLTRQIASIDRQDATCKMTCFVRCQPDHACPDRVSCYEVAIREYIKMIHQLQHLLV